jgi:hypothetical protein
MAPVDMVNQSSTPPHMDPSQPPVDMVNQSSTPVSVELPTVTDPPPEPPPPILPTRMDYTDFHNVGYSWITEEDDYPNRAAIKEAREKYYPEEASLQNSLLQKSLHNGIYYCRVPRRSDTPAPPLTIIWIPAEAKDLQVRCCIAAHYGGAAHRDFTTTHTYLQRAVWWPTLETDLKGFYKSCLACKQQNGPKIARVPFGETIKATYPGEVLQYDYLHIKKLPMSNNMEYILVLKDKFSKFTILNPCASPDALNATTAIFSWIQHFGTPNGTHEDSLTCAGYFDSRLCPIRSCTS